jgi:hypothetical protein
MALYETSVKNGLGGILHENGTVGIHNGITVSAMTHHNRLEELITICREATVNEIQIDFVWFPSGDIERIAGDILWKHQQLGKVVHTLGDK